MTSPASASSLIPSLPAGRIGGIMYRMSAVLLWTRIRRSASNSASSRSRRPSSTQARATSRVPQAGAELEARPGLRVAPVVAKPELERGAERPPASATVREPSSTARSRLASAREVTGVGRRDRVGFRADPERSRGHGIDGDGEREPRIERETDERRGGKSRERHAARGRAGQDSGRADRARPCGAPARSVRWRRSWPAREKRAAPRDDATR